MMHDQAKLGTNCRKTKTSRSLAKTLAARVLPLSEHSAAVKGLKQTDTMMLYCLREKKAEAEQIILNME